jgi:hypothetical protein
MSPSITGTALAASVAGSLLFAPSALARGAVFGGATAASQAIVVRTDAKAKRLSSAVIAWTADCKGGQTWADSSEMTAVRAEPGFTPGSGELLVSRNRRGRFAGTQQYARSAGEFSAAVTVRLSGRTHGKRATGTLDANVALFDADGNMQDGCDSGTVKWTASRADGRIFGGKTSQQQPVVVRVDAGRRKVSDLMIGWGSESCVPEGYLAYGERFGNFPLKDRRFGDAFTQSYAMDGGSNRTYAYDLRGKVARTAARGSLRVQVTQTDATGAQTLSCDSGTVAWRALTG